MLLEDLVSPKVKTIQTKERFKRPIMNKASVHPDDFIGAGGASMVYKDRNDPHMVTKRTMGERNKDGFSIYAKFIIDNKLWQENPYFPRIYVMKNFIDTDGDEIQKYQLEKLLGHEEFDTRMLKNVYFNTFGRHDRNYDTVKKLKDDDWYNSRVHAYIAEGIESSYKKYEGYDIKDDKLKEAGEWLIKLSREIGRNINDLAGDNLLYRRTKYGIHPVISDPLF